MGGPGARAFAMVVWLLGTLQASACASDLVLEDDRYQHRRHHYSIAIPGGEDPAWRPVRVEGAVLAFQGPGRASMSLIEQCGRPSASPRVLARQLLIGLEGRKLVSQGPVAGGEPPGWIQRLDARRDGELVHLKTVTRVIGRCSYDWVLVVPGEFEAVEPVFDRWWGSFRSSSPLAAPEQDG